MDRGTIVEWRVKPGDAVKRGDIVAVVQTDKADIEVETFSGGIVDEIVVPEGQEVAVGAVLARVRAVGEEAGAPAQLPTPSASAQPPTPSGSVMVPPHPTVLSPMLRSLADAGHVDLASVTPTGPGGVVTREDVEAAVRRRCAPSPRPAPAQLVRASPRARKLAAALGVDLATVAGSGPGGAVTGRDLDRAGGTAPAGFATPSARSKPPRPQTSEDQQGSRRAAVGTLMARSKRDIPHYYVSTQVDMSAALRWLDGQNQARDVTTRILPAALLLKATVRATLQTPEVNGFWVNEHFEPCSGVDLGVAVSLRGGGLLAPTIPGADRLTLDELMLQLRVLVAHARVGRLRSGEMSPPSITVTNLGDEGVETVFPIIYPPQVAMVGFGKITPRPWAVDGMLGVRPVVTATLAADHRASDGRRGSRFLTLIDHLLQDPETL